MTKILVFGMHRSGTTLLSDLFSKHPAVKKMFHEATLMSYGRDELFTATTLGDYRMLQTEGELTRARNAEPYEWPVSFDLQNETWGAKMSYPGPVILQDWRDLTVKYAQRWLDYFAGDSRIVHILRHPYDIYLSAAKRWRDDPGHIANYAEVTLENICRDWAVSLIGLNELFADDDRVMQVHYEQFVQDPASWLTQLYRFCGLDDPDHTAREALSKSVIFFGQVDAARANRHRQHQLTGLSNATRVLLQSLQTGYPYEYP